MAQTGKKQMIGITEIQPKQNTPSNIIEGYIRGPDEQNILFGASLAIMTIYGIFSGNGGFIIFTGPLACFFLYRAYRAHQHRKSPRICEIYNDGIWFNKYKIFIPKALLSQALHFDTNIIVTAELNEANLKSSPEIRERLHLHLSRTGEDSYKLSLPLLDESKREEFTNYTPQEVQKEIEQYITKANGSTPE